VATEAQKQILRDGVSRLVDSKFGGDWERMFRHYAGISGGSDMVERRDLIPLLEDAGIGNGFSRGAWAKGILEEVDTSGDESISPEELRAVLTRF
jgi:hypothetical protein